MGQFNLELAPPPGLAPDDTTFGAQGRWADGSNVRFVEGRPQTLGRIVYTNNTEPGGVSPLATGAVAVFAATIGTNAYVIVGTGSALYAASTGSSLTDITPAATSATYWSFAMWGDHLAAVFKGDRLYVDTGTGVTSLTLVATAPLQITHMLITPERQVLALGCNEEVSGTFNPRCIRGSDLEDYTNWTTASNNNVFEHILDGSGSIVAGRIVGSYVAVWTTGALYLGQFLGDPSQTYRFDKIADVGLKGPAAVTILGGVAYWMSPDHGFWSWAPGGLPVAIPCTVQHDFLANLVVNGLADTKCFAVSNSLYGEVWWFYPDARDAATGGFRYVAVNVRDGTWFRGQLDRRAGGEFPFMYNPTNFVASRSFRPMLTVDGDGRVYSHEVEGSLGTAADVAWFIQSADQYLNSGRVRVMVRDVDPDFVQQTDDVAMTLYAKDRPQSTAVTKGPYTLTAGLSRKCFRASGMILSVKFSGTKGQARLGKPTFDCVTMGGR